MHSISITVPLPGARACRHDRGGHGLGQEVDVDLVHGGKVLHAGQEDVDLDDLLERGASQLENLLHVLQSSALGGLDGARQGMSQGTYRCLLNLARGGLAGAEDQARDLASRVVVRLGGELFAVDKLARHDEESNRVVKIDDLDGSRFGSACTENMV